MRETGVQIVTGQVDALFLVMCMTDFLNSVTVAN